MSQEWAYLVILAMYSHWLETALLEAYPQLKCSDGSRGPTVRPSVNYAPKARDLSGTFSWLQKKKSQKT